MSDNIKKSCLSCINSSVSMWCEPCDICDNFSRWESINSRDCSSCTTEDKPIDTGTAQSSPHYNKLVLQPVEMNQLCLTKEEFIGFLKGNIIKYSMRCGLKDEVEKEQNKIRQYKKWLDEALEGKIINPRESD